MGMSMIIRLQVDDVWHSLYRLNLVTILIVLINHMNEGK